MKQKFETKKNGKKITIFVNLFSADRADVEISEEFFFTETKRQIFGMHDWQLARLLRNYNLLPTIQREQPQEEPQATFMHLPLYLIEKLS